MVSCSWIWMTIDGVNGYKVQSEKSGYTDNWIFLPAAGFRCSDFIDAVGLQGFYWSSSLRTDDPDDACDMYFRTILFYGDLNNRFYGQSVRPVSE